ncbi:MAG: YicC family protein [Oxalobacteraceae bacterium]|nr:YicC family protein [Oxalobacteraceae bacterium]
MTGYAISTRESDAGTITLELKSVNSRFLDLQFRMNDDLRTLEPLLREAIMGKVQRGKVECRLSFGRKVASGASLAINESLMLSVLSDSEIGEDNLLADVQATMATALTAFVDSREREGASLETMLLSRVTDIEHIVERISPLIPQAIEQFRQKAIDRMQEALGISLNTGNATPSISKDEVQDRIRQEVTLYGIRMDVAEELTRLSGHLTETRAILKKGGQVGKRLDFMMQELNREANTLGSKAALKELSDASMQMKLLIEQMREQVQNLE